MKNKISNEFWAKVFYCMVYLSNHYYNQNIWNKIPQLAWNGRKLDISHFKVWEIITFAHIPNKKLSKLDDEWWISFH